VTPSATQYAQNRQAVNAVDAGDGDYAVKTLRARLDANPRDLTTRLELARRYQKLGFPEVAIEHCRLACERAPDSDEAHIALAKMLREQGRTAEGAKILAEYSTKHDTNVAVLAWLGLMHDEAGELKAGEAAHRKALALAPNRADLHNNLGYCLLRQNKKKEAAEEFRAALRLDSRSVVASNNLAAAIGESSRKEAVERLQSVTDPASAHNNMAAVLIDDGKYTEARREIDIALSYNRQHSAALSNLALVSQMDGQPATVKAPVTAPLVNEGRWTRAFRAWRHLWSSGAPTDRTTKDTGTAAVSH
jgi:Flp pilus assembly protein TadD